MDLEKLYPIMIKPVAPFRNVLKAFKDNPNFGDIWDLTNSAIINVIIVGAGGTGGYVAAEIMRYVSNLPVTLQRRIFITVCDGDTFESKNVSRQLCSDDDLGVNKAEAIVSKYSSYFNNLDGHVFAYPNFITHPSQLMDLNYGIRYMSTKVSGHTYDFSKFLSEKCREKLAMSTNDTTCKFLNEVAISDANKHTFVMSAPREKVRCNNNSMCPTTITLPEFEDDDDSYINNKRIVFETNVAYTIPIIIDCVDKTTVRNIIHQALQLYTALDTHSQFLGSSIYSYLDTSIGTDLETSEMSRDTLDECLSEKMDVLYVAPNNIVLCEHKDGYENKSYTYNIISETTELDSVVNQIPITYGDSIEENIIYNKVEDIPYPPINTSIGRMSTNRMLYGIGDAYIISSGNSEFTGQVSWGRYSSLLTNIIAPLTFKGVFPHKTKSPRYNKKGADEVIKYFEDNITEIKNSNNKDLNDYVYNFVKFTLDDVVNNDEIITTTKNLLSLKNNRNISGIKIGEINDVVLLDFNMDESKCIDAIYKSQYIKCVAVDGDDRNKNSDYLQKITKGYQLKGGLFNSLKYIHAENGETLDNAAFGDYDVSQAPLAHSYVLRTLEENKYPPYVFEYSQINPKYFSQLRDNVSYVMASDGRRVKNSELFYNYQDWVSQYISVPTPYMVNEELIDLREDLKEEQLSCADRAEQNIQSINANKTAAMLVLNYFTEIMNGLLSLKTDGGKMVHMNNYKTAFDTRKNTYISYPITTDFLYDYSDCFAQQKTNEICNYIDSEGKGYKLEDLSTNAKFKVEDKSQV